jgi:hypothetical protein
VLALEGSEALACVKLLMPPIPVLQPTSTMAKMEMMVWKELMEDKEYKATLATLADSTRLQPVLRETQALPMVPEVAVAVAVAAKAASLPQ